MISTNKYPATTIPNSVKTAFARLYLVQAENGKRRRDFFDEVSAAGYDISKRSFNRHIEMVNVGGTGFSSSKMSGKKAALTEDEREILAGWLLCEVEVHRSVHLDDYRRAAATFFRVALSASTASRYLADDGFTYKSAQGKKGGFGLDEAALARLAWEWVDAHQKGGVFKEPHRLCSIDFTYTSHRSNKPSSFAPSGCAQPKVDVHLTSYTNCIVTCVWADGRNRTPPVLFTYNQEFRLDRPPTARRIAQVAHLRSCLQWYDIEPHRIIYVGTDKGEHRTYCSESAELIRRFFNLWKVREHGIAFSDNGNAIYPQGNSVLLALGFDSHYPYPAPVHQYLSPNDNNLHGSAKASWRSMCDNFDDDVDRCCMLLNHLDFDISHHSKQWFVRNMVKATQASTSLLISGGSAEMHSINNERKRNFCIFRGEYARGGLSQVTKEASDELNG